VGWSVSFNTMSFGGRVAQGPAAAGIDGYHRKGPGTMGQDGPTVGVGLAADFRPFAGLRYGGEAGSEAQAVDLHVPVDVREAHPTFVCFHGGGWVTGSRAAAALHLLPWMERGWATANVGYRLAPEAEAPAAVWDALRGVEWLVRHGPDYGLNVGPLVLGGFSSGAHLALMTGTTGPPFPGSEGSEGEGRGLPRPVALVNWFGITDVAGLLGGARPRAYARRWIGARTDALELARSLSPLTRIGADTPPVITVHGTEDRTVPFEQSVRLHEALERAGVRNRLVALQGVGHGGFDRETWAAAYEAVFQFVDPGMPGRSGAAGASA